MKREIRLLMATLLILLMASVAFAEGDTHIHSWSDWTIRTAATCTADGVKVRICSTCGQTETSAIPATGHA